LCSSRYFDVYRLNLVFDDDDEDDGLKFVCSMANRYSSSGWLEFRLKFEKAKSLMRFLMPKFFGVHYEEEFNSIRLFNQAVNLIHISKGKFY
jgi:hypothetical protein